MENENRARAIEENVYAIKGTVSLLRDELYSWFKQLGGILLAILFVLILIAINLD